MIKFYYALTVFFPSGGGKEMSKMMGSGIGGMGSNPLDLTSANAVKIQSSLGDLFDESDEEDSQNVSLRRLVQLHVHHATSYTEY